jgi:hypothetical protein
MVQRCLHETIIGNIDSLFKEATVDLILSTEVVLDVSVYVQSTPEYSKVLLSPNVVPGESPSRPCID